MRILPFQRNTLVPRQLVERSVLLRPATMDDFNSWRQLRLQSREFLQPWEPLWGKDELSRGAFRVRLNQQRADHASGRGQHWLIISNDGREQVLGGIAISNIRRNVCDSGTLGYWMGAPFAGQGLMTMALSVVCREAFSHLSITRLEAAALPENTASCALLARCGFSREGLARSYMKINGTWQDHVLFARLAEQRSA